MKRQSKKMVSMLALVLMLMSITIPVGATQHHELVDDASPRSSTIHFNDFTIGNGIAGRSPVYNIYKGTVVTIYLEVDHLSEIEVYCKNIDLDHVVTSTNKWTTNGGTVTMTIPYTGNYQFFFKNWEAGNVTFKNVSLTF